MGVRIIKAHFDDLDQSEYGEGEGQTIEFGIDGSQYSIDLTNENAAKLREALKPFIDVASPQPRKRGRWGTTAKPVGVTDTMTIAERRALTQRIREFGREKGMQISDRGPLPAGLKEDYFAAGLK